METTNESASLQQAPLKKKISFFAAILVVMGSSIGAGIFFKAKGVLENSQSSFVMAIFSWIIAAVAVMAMALALIEVASVRNDNLSLIGWTKVFNGRTTYKATKNFMFYIYLPLTYFFMPLYVIMSLQDGLGALINADGTALTIGTNVDWLIWTIVGLAISSYFIVVAGWSAKAGDIQNKLVTYIKFIPLAMVVILGITLVGMNASGVNNINSGFKPPMINDTVQDSLAAGATINQMVPTIGVGLAISGIFFAYDGFYVASGIQSEMAKPKKTPMAIVIGLLATTVIYLAIAIAMSLNGGDVFAMQDFMKQAFGDQAGRIIFGIINLMIAIGVLGIINGFAMWAPRFTEDLIKGGELPFSFKYKHYLNENKPKVGIVYSFVITLPIVIIFSLIGALAYIDTGGYGDGYGSQMAQLYSFADLMGTWTALFTFGFIMMAIAGAYRNRKTNLIKTEQKRYFKVAAIISMIAITLALAITILAPFLDLMLISQINLDLVELAKRNYQELVVSRVMLVITFMIFVGLSYGITIIEDQINIRHFGSLAKYQEWHQEHFVSV